MDLATRARGMGIWDWDIDRNELLWDERMYRLYKVNKEDFSGAYEAWLARIHPDDREISDMFSKQAREGEKEYDTEFRIVWPDGTVRIIKAYGQIVREVERCAAGKARTRLVPHMGGGVHLPETILEAIREEAK